MKKNYIKPSMKAYRLRIQQTLLVGTVGVQTEDSLGKEYNKDDISYSNANRDIIDDEEDLY